MQIVVEVMTLGTPHVLELWLGVVKDMLSVKYFHSNTSSFVCPLNFVECHKVEVDVAILNLWGYYLI